MVGIEQFRTELAALVTKVPQVEAIIRGTGSGQKAAKPEAVTEDQLIEPLLDALGFDRDHRTPQSTIPQSATNRLSWVDYRLNGTPADRQGLMLVEVKPITDTGDLWADHGKQTRRYLRDYQLALGDKEPVRWIVLTNFRELHILNIADRKPFIKLTFDRYAEDADLLYRLLNREQLVNDQISSIYYEKRHAALGKSFLNDLKLWRLVLANGLREAQPGLTVDQAKVLSQQILNRIILIRVLETHGLHHYYSLVHQYLDWHTYVRNHDRFPFFDKELMPTFDDIEIDLNTDLFKHSLMDRVRETLTDAEGRPLMQLTLPNKHARALVDPDVIWSDEDHDIRELIGRQTGQQRYAYSTPYNYDFHTLTTDIIGQVYEQFLAHSLTEEDGRIMVRSDQTLRQREGAYYTPVPVVNFLVQGTLGRLVKAIRWEAEQHLNQRRYADAQAAIDQLTAIKVLDLACGSGTFLIAAYEVLLDVYHWWNQRLHRVRADDFRQDWIKFLESGLRPQQEPGDSILRHNLFGIDRDSQAVEMAKLNLWLLLLRTQPEDYARHEGKPPKNKLPDLTGNIIAADALYPILDVDALLGTSSQTRVILGNPPWGADLSSYGTQLSSYELAKGQYDSYELFIERATAFLRPGDLIGYVVPDSILQPPEHTRLREFILQQYQIDALVKLGEGIFEDVFRGAVALHFVRATDVPNSHMVRSRIVVKSERDQVLKTPRENTLQALLDTTGYDKVQARFAGNKDKVFDLFVEPADEPVLDAIDVDALDWEAVTTSTRGVELAKSGMVMACPHCNIWQNIPFKQKNGTYRSVTCANPKCARTITYEECTKAKIIESSLTPQCTQPIIVGEGINRYQTRDMRYIDLSKVKYVPCCPNPDPTNPKRACGEFDPAAPAGFVPGEVRKCARCGATYTSATVTKYVRLGINYKPPETYAGEKLLVRKTGRGIYATIDRTGAYTTQVVFIFKLKDRAYLPEEHKKLRLGYILGVLNSRMMLYRYYKGIGDIEWKSFPYMTQDTIMGLPIRRIDFSDARQADLHDRIANMVDGVIATGKPPDVATDAAIEQLVRELYGVDTPVASARIDAELARIATYGSLLGTSGDVDEEDAETGNAADVNAGIVIEREGK